MASDLLDALAAMAAQMSAGMPARAGSTSSSDHAASANLRLAKTVERYFDF